MLAKILIPSVKNIGNSINKTASPEQKINDITLDLCYKST